MEDNDPRILNNHGKVLIGLTVRQLIQLLSRDPDAELVEKLEKTLALLEYSTKREIFVKGR